MKVSELFESADQEQKRLEKMVRAALNDGDDYTAKQYAKMAPTPEGKKALSKIIRDEMHAVSESLNEDIQQDLADAIAGNWLSLSKAGILKALKANIKAGMWPKLEGKSDAELEDLIDDAHYDAHNQVDEAVAGKGMWVIKNKDGVEKRFKDDESPAAKAWKESSKPKRAPAVKAEKYSQEWWEAKEEKGGYDVLTPWTRIELGMGHGELSTDELEAVGKDQGFGNVDDFHKLGTGETKVDGVYCATIRVRVVAVYTKEDDLGIEGDEPVSDSYNVMLRRDTKNPEKFVFMRYL